MVSFFGSRLRSWRDPGLFFALMLAIGPGLIVNGVFKPYWGRPCQHPTIPFGGDQEFLPVLQKGCDQDYVSFPCGHASMGFSRHGPGVRFLPPQALVGDGIPAPRAGRRHYPNRGGSAFASDVLWSGGFVYFTGLALAAVFRLTTDAASPLCRGNPNGEGG